MNRSELDALEAGLGRFRREHVASPPYPAGGEDRDAAVAVADVLSLIAAAESDGTPDAAPGVAEALGLLLDSRVVCLGCVVERRNAEAAGASGDELPDVNTANLNVGGESRCFAHVQIVNGPVLPGQTPSGLMLPTGVQIPGGL